MIRILIPILLFCLILGACTMMKRRPLQRGLVGDTFVSTGKPAFALEAHAPLQLNSAGVMDLQLHTMQLGNANASASCWYAFYVNHGQKARAMPIAVSQDTSDNPSALLAFLVDAQNPWQWEMSVASGYQEVHVDNIEIDGKPAHAATFMMPLDKDPWAPLIYAAGLNLGPDDNVLVRRFTLLMQQRRAKLIIEYREAVPTNSAVRPLEDFAALAAFEQRAEQAFTLHTSPTGKAPTVTQLTYAPDSIKRKAVAASLGIVRRRNQD